MRFYGTVHLGKGAKALGTKKTRPHRLNSTLPSIQQTLRKNGHGKEEKEEEESQDVSLVFAKHSDVFRQSGRT
jgi:hypothetical protein